MGGAAIEFRPNCSHPFRHTVHSKYRMTVNEAIPQQEDFDVGTE